MASLLHIDALSQPMTQATARKRSRLRILQERLRVCRRRALTFTDLLAWRWPLFQVLDRLQMPTETVVQIVPSPLAGGEGRCGEFHADGAVMYLPRTHMPGSYGIVGDVIRSTRTPHCSIVFQNVFDILLDKLATKVRFEVADVGGMLCDCCLWATVRARRAGVFSSNLTCTEYESHTLWARLAQSTVLANGLQAQVHVRKVAVSSGDIGSFGKPLDKLTPCRNQSSRDPKVLLLKIHTDGREAEVLAGAVKILSCHDMAVVVVRSGALEDFSSKVVREGAERIRDWLRLTGLDVLYDMVSVAGQTVLVRRAQSRPSLVADEWYATTRALASSNLGQRVAVC
eukprot:TRINITY_DN48419_c0_g1_i1.p1 TRINITY_DN48419_c0_g1~~TRINITY_DN48419_c0_g1_i1.p1  ORF type:complete len:342 (+),score=37.79 TRINITY_DN48419_c0_g1_i1:564-1589(+)